MSWLQEALRKGNDPGRRVASEVLQELHACGFLLVEVNGSRLIVSISGIQAGTELTPEQRKAAADLGGLIGGALPSPSGPCAKCGATMFTIGADLVRRCGFCERG